MNAIEKAHEKTLKIRTIGAMVKRADSSVVGRVYGMSLSRAMVEWRGGEKRYTSENWYDLEAVQS
jgi:hypothetical protein